MSTDKIRYVELAAQTPRLPIFMQPWWLDAVVESHSWDVVLAEEDHKLAACFTFVIKRKGPFTSLGMPALTPYLGPWFSADGHDTAGKRQLYSRLLHMLPPHDKFYMKFRTTESGLNLVTPGCTPVQLYTYTLSNIKDHEQLYAGFKSNLRGKIRKAEKLVSIGQSDNADMLYDLCRMTYHRQDKEAEISRALVRSICRASLERGKGIIMMASDGNGKVHAATLLVWDQDCGYYLLNGGDPALRSSGANSLLMWEVVKYASRYVDTFDFEGSMIPGVEVFIRGFGPVKTTYSLFTKTNSTIVSVADSVRKILKG